MNIKLNIELLCVLIVPKHPLGAKQFPWLLKKYYFEYIL